MQTEHCRVLVVLLTFLVAQANAERMALPDLAAPPQGSAQWISRSMRMNGLPMSVKAFESRLAPEAVLAHYESALRSSASHHMRRSVNSPWQVLTVRSRDHFITIHARAAASGSEGTILVSPALDPAVIKLQTDFPRPSTARIVNLQQYDDSGMRSEHISLASERAPFVEAQAFSQLLITQGWSIVDTRPTRASYRGFVLEAQRQAEQAMLVIIPDASRSATTAIVVTWKKS